MSEYDPENDAVGSYYAAIEAKRVRGDAVSDDQLTAAIIVLARFGIAPDIQDLLVIGNPMRGIPRHALKAAIGAAMEHHTNVL